MRPDTVSLLALLLVLAPVTACDEGPAETTTITIDGAPHEVVDAYGVVEGRDHELFFTFDDESTLILGGDGLFGVRRQVTAASGGVVAIYTPPGGGPFTWFAGGLATGHFLIDHVDLTETSAEGDFSLDLRQPTDESVILQGVFSGIPLSPGVVTHHGSSFECRLRAYRASGEHLSGGRLVNNADRDYMALGAQFNSTASITIFVPRDIAPGQYFIGVDDVSGSIGDDPYSGQASSGNIRILEHDVPEQRIVGEFAFEGTANEPAGGMVTFLVNAGAFDLRYIIQD